MISIDCEIVDFHERKLLKQHCHSDSLHYYDICEDDGLLLTSYLVSPLKWD